MNSRYGMRLATLIMTDGRDKYLRQSIDSLYLNLVGLSSQLYIHDDSGSEDHRQALEDRYPEFTILGDGPRRGFSGAMQYAWGCMRNVEADLIFHTEDDFLYNRPICLLGMAHLLSKDPELAQVVLLRQPWNDEEIAAGGIMQTRPNTYTQREIDGITFCEHRNFWSCNPSLFRQDLLEQFTWPNVPMAEAVFGQTLVDAGMKFAYLGGKTDSPLVEHIGYKRAGTGY